MIRICRIGFRSMSGLLKGSKSPTGPCLGTRPLTVMFRFVCPEFVKLGSQLGVYEMLLSGELVVAYSGAYKCHGRDCNCDEIRSNSDDGIAGLSWLLLSPLVVLCCCKAMTMTVPRFYRLCGYVYVPSLSG